MNMNEVLSALTLSPDDEKAKAEFRAQYHSLKAQQEARRRAHTEQYDAIRRAERERVLKRLVEAASATNPVPQSKYAKYGIIILVLVVPAAIYIYQYQQQQEQKRQQKRQEQERQERKRLEALQKQQEKSVKVRFERLFKFAGQLLKNPTKITQARLVKLVSHASGLLLTMYAVGREKLQAVWKSALAIFWKHKKSAAEVLASTVESLRNLSNAAKALILTASIAALLKVTKKANFQKLRQGIMGMVHRISGKARNQNKFL